MKKHMLNMALVAAMSVGGAQAATIVWTGNGGDGLWGTAENWDNGVPSSSDTVIIGAGATVQDTGGVAGNFAELELAEGSSLAYSGSGGDMGGIWNVNGTVLSNGGNGTFGIGGSGVTFNFGVNGSFTMAGGTQNNLWANGNALTISGVIDLGAAPAGTLVEKTLFSWAGSLSGGGFGSITESFTELNGLGLVRVADNADVSTLKAGEYSFQTNLTSNGSIGVAYVTAQAVPEPSSAALLGLGGLAMILRRRK
ncbi:PEP-CTERM sorting domain-containing protein [Sulfuriroseicoccus oceanibius]|uniref:PEP-CTERM sorting domain-containing protein n=1 Tax=Sulfuriroseicoccus oceanibius TaxID=2707525 RepID=A0A6B3L7G3_9BACT|nr:PEP-CTERM sorting domain-containing protein [Sulfuriroseicoccus oceanibius]QQL43673.1 PEP-CTERM sorting domain-containing protein [Sulfuriroseicoccus oceanibius]